jgi:hypothetical protein
MWRWIVLLGFAAVIGATAPAFANESAYTDFPLQNNKCKPVDPAKADSDAETGSVELICPGYKDYAVYYDEGDARVSIHYGHLSQDVIKNYWESFTPFNSAAEKIEWRVDAGGVPRAVIHRFFLANTNPATGMASEKLKGQVLVISRVGQPGDKTGCVVGMVDALANKDANAIARRVADEIAPGFLCKQDQAVYHGRRGDKSSDLSTSFGE